MNRTSRCLACLIVGAWAAPAAAQSTGFTAPAVPIQDNSFLVEEAYNQERGVVQHISTFARDSRAGAWVYSFTQEWPVSSYRHQLSYTLPVSRSSAAEGGRSGIGDLAINYRHQVGSTGSSPVVVAPRASIVLPTGSSRRGFGRGGAGAQVNLPVSMTLGTALVAHSNAGATWTPSARDAAGNRAATTDLALGQSLIWLARPKLNLLIEAVWSRTEDVLGRDRIGRSEEFLLSPGIRGAIDFRSGLQVVPGIAFPIGVGPSRGQRAVFAYLSFEHAFGATDTP